MGVTLLIDNYDSYTYNLYQMLARVNNGIVPIVIKNDELVISKECTTEAQVLDLLQHHCTTDRIDNIVISPGPGRPSIDSDMGISLTVLKLVQNIPILGVCLGHQGIAHVHGASVVQATEGVHGRTSSINVLAPHDLLFENIPSTFSVVRYHSLIVEAISPELTVLACTNEDDIIMALRHVSKPFWGVQFHPESVGSEYGYQLLSNFYSISNGMASRCEWPVSPRELKYDDDIHSKNSMVNESFTLRTMELPSNNNMSLEELYATLYKDSEHTFWLDSAVVSDATRYSFMGDASGPLSLRVEYYRPNKKDDDDTNFKVYDCNNNLLKDERVSDATNLLEFMQQTLDKYAGATDEADLPFDFQTGFVGYFGYDLLRCSDTKTRTLPDATFIFCDRAVAFDTKTKRVFLMTIQQRNKCKENDDDDNSCWFNTTKNKVQSASVPVVPPTTPYSKKSVEFHPTRSKDEYLRNVTTILEEIKKGETYEVCLTNQLVARNTKIECPLELYNTIRRVNPAPYGAYFHYDSSQAEPEAEPSTNLNFSICCASPERFLKRDATGWIESKPIKGTRKRDLTNLENDKEIAQELACCVKDRAENMMILDLVRNDFGRVCNVSSVHVPAYLQVETYATVHQLVSTVRGHAPKVSIAALLQATFPGGSMTGAPKTRTMDIIRKLEKHDESLNHERGIYSGSFGYLSIHKGTMDLNIVIRTAVVLNDNSTIRLGSGGAVIGLSDPNEEYEEMLVKTRAMVNAVEQYHMG